MPDKDGMELVNRWKANLSNSGYCSSV